VNYDYNNKSLVYFDPSPERSSLDMLTTPNNCMSLRMILQISKICYLLLLNLNF